MILTSIYHFYTTIFMKPIHYPIVKHNDLIEARYKLTLCEQKLVLGIVMQIKPDDKDFHEYHLSVQDFTKLMEVEGEGYHHRIKQKSKEILQKPVVLRQDGGWLLCNWFSSIEYAEEKGVIEFHFDPKLKPYLLQLQNKFTEYNSANVMRLESKFSIRLYELLKQYLTIGERIITLIELRLMLGIEDGYKYADIKRQILEYCKKELSDKSDITYDYKPIKTGRQVTAIRFFIFINEKAALPSKQLTHEEQKLLNTIPVQQPTKTLKKAVRRAIKTHGIEGAQEIVTKVSTRHSKGKVDKVGAYATTCLNNGYGVKTPEERAAELEKRKKEIERQEALLKKQTAELEKARKDLEEQEKKRKIDLEIDGLPEEQRERLGAEAEKRVIAEHNGQKPMGLNMHIAFKMREIFAEWKNQSEPTQMELFSHPTDKNA